MMLATLSAAIRSSRPWSAAKVRLRALRFGAACLALVLIAAPAQAQLFGSPFPIVPAPLSLPSGAAGGDLGGTYPNPTVISIADITTGTLLVINGGTGSSTAAGARTNLGLTIGTNVQAWNANLDSWAAITRATGFDGFTATPSSANLRALLTDESGTGAALFANGALGTPVSGVATNLTGTAAGLTAGNVTTNANATGPITLTGNTTSVTAQTGTGSTFVMAASPTGTGTWTLPTVITSGTITDGGDLLLTSGSGIKINNIFDVNQLSSAGLVLSSTKALAWVSGTTLSATPDTRLSRLSAGAISADTTTTGDSLATFKAANLATVSSNWTPTDASGAGVTLTCANTCKSARVGPFVYLFGDITVGVTASTSQVQIGGMPTTALNANNPGSWVMSDVVGAGDLALVNNGTTNFKVFTSTGANRTWVSLSGQTIYFSGFYAVN